MFGNKKPKSNITAPVSMNPFNPGQNADPMPVPASAYTFTRSPLKSPYRPEEGANIRSRSAAVSRVPRRKGWIQNYVHGDEIMTKQIGTRMRATGQAESTAFQPVMRNLWDWFINTGWYEAGYPAATVMNGGAHNLALSFRADQLKTKQTGGPTNSYMNSKPVFTRVQNIRRYSTTPLAYDTMSPNIK